MALNPRAVASLAGRRNWPVISLSHGSAPLLLSLTRRCRKMSENVALEKDVMLALALASGTKIVDAAEQAGVCRRTVERKLAEPDFRRMVAELRAEMVAAALGRLTDS